ncbi:hypothetical protein AB0I52_12475 [Streptomyces sp. NPDC050423]|uniref:hypothetical protein n=1 Tax=Streptomyces sp. NPDC050423 TaxID=3155402 RepID=UPI003419DFA5
MGGHGAVLGVDVTQAMPGAAARTGRARLPRRAGRRLVRHDDADSRFLALADPHRP